MKNKNELRFEINDLELIENVISSATVRIKTEIGKKIIYSELFTALSLIIFGSVLVVGGYYLIALLLDLRKGLDFLIITFLISMFVIGLFIVKECKSIIYSYGNLKLSSRRLNDEELLTLKQGSERLKQELINLIKHNNGNRFTYEQLSYLGYIASNEIKIEKEIKIIQS